MVGPFLDGQAARMEESSRRLGRPITKQVVICNAAGMQLKPNPDAVTAFKDFLLLSSRDSSVAKDINQPMVVVSRD
eukprot:Skav206585  [mRNA]  locus=scaffold5652:27358:29652:- [translate_table: standard]